MGLNKQKGGMYSFVTHTWNAIRGKCPHDCSYCYMKKFPVGDLRLIEKELETDLGEDKFIFVGSSCDMWADVIPDDWKRAVLVHCCKFDNKYLFQSKNPADFAKFEFPPRTILGTTIETNENYLGVSKAPLPFQRIADIKKLNYPRMISIEPIIAFDLNVLLQWIAEVKPEFVSVGADSKKYRLTEPEPMEVIKLLDGLKQITKVHVKDNLQRIIG